MNIDEAAKVIRGRFKTVITDTVPVITQFENLPFERPEEARYVKVTIIPGESRQVSLGGSSNRFRTSGIMLASIFGVLEAGDEAIFQLADTVANAFRAVTVSNVTFRTPSVIRVGRAGKWWQVNVSCPWYLDKIA